MATKPNEIFFCKLVAELGLTGVDVLAGADVVAVGAIPVMLVEKVVVTGVVGTRGAVVVVVTLPVSVVVVSIGEMVMEAVTSGLTEGEGEAETDDMFVLVVLVVVGVERVCLSCLSWRSVVVKVEEKNGKVKGLYTPWRLN